MNVIRRLLARRRLDRDLADEIRQHLEEKADELVDAGVPRDDAIRIARREFGNVTLIEERGRDVWRWQVVEDGLSDVRYAVRQWRRSPAFAAAAILTLALGIGANTAVFSAVSALVLRPLPFPDADRLVAVRAVDRRSSSAHRLSYPNFFDFRGQTRTLSHLASYHDTDLTLTGRGEPVYLRGQIVSWDLFQTLGVAPVLGRAFVEDEERAGARVAILSHETWLSHFGGEHAIVGRAILLDGEGVTVIGVAPPGFSYPLAARPVDVWTTLAADRRSNSTTPVTEQRGAGIINVVGQLAPGVSLAQARAEMDAIAARLHRQHPDQNANIPTTDIRPELELILGDARDAVLILWAAVALVLLVACANVANLLVARTADRARELDVRLAIGGSAGRILRQLVTENLLLSVAGGAAGLAVASVAMHLLLPLAAGLPRVAEIALDGRVFVFAALIAAATSLIVSVPAALRLTRGQVGRPLLTTARTVTGSQRWIRGATVVAQIAVSLVLLSAAAWMMTAFLRVTGRELGFESRHLMTFEVSMPGVGYDADRQVQFIDRLVEQVAALPGVTHAATAMPIPLARHPIGMSFAIEGRPSPSKGRPASEMAIVSSGYFATMRTALVAGRDFSEFDDGRHPRVAIVNQAFADKFFPGQSPLGMRIQPGATGPYDEGSPLREIVGVVGNVRQSPLALGPEPIFYLPFRQIPWGASFVVRSELSPASLLPALRAATSALEGRAAVHDLHGFDELLTRGVAGPQLVVLLIGSFAATALLLTTTGLYGLLAYSVQQRTREIGVRMALGAQRSAIVSMVTGEALILVAAGLALGGSGTLVATAVLRSRWPFPGPPLTLTLAVACVTVLLTAAVSASVPARRAAGVDPTQALRSE